MEEFVPDWSGLLQMLSPTKKTKKKREPVTFEQRELLLNFISENPEMMTHSSTRESEQALWEELTKKLNLLQPEKTVECWRIFWRRWQMNLQNKPEASLTMIDYRLKKFLTHLGIDSNEAIEKVNSKRRLSFDEVCNRLKDVEEEKVKIKLEIDEMDIKIVQYKNNIKELEKKIVQKRKRNKELMIMRTSLTHKKRKIEGKENYQIG